MQSDLSAKLSSPAEPRPGSSPPPRNNALYFIVVFLSVSFTLLAGFRYVIDSTGMSWYLFQVARGTAWAMDLAGDSANFITVLTLPASPAEARAEIHRVLNDDVTAAASAFSNAPLSDWERFQYERAVTKKAPAIEEAAVQSLAGPSTLRIESPEQHVNVLYGLIERLTAEAQRQEQSPFAFDRPHPEWNAALASTQTRLHDLTLFKLAESGPALLAIHEELAALQGQLEEVLQRRIREAHATVAASGPIIRFVLRSGPQPLQFSIRIIAECGALESIAIFFAAVVAFPTTAGKRALGLLLGMPILFVINVLRLACLGIVGAIWGPGDVFDFAHHYVWQGVYLIFVVMLWLLWMALIVLRDAERHGPSPLREPLVLLTRFIVLVPIVGLVWWWCMPAYLTAVGTIAAGASRLFFGSGLDGAVAERAVTGTSLPDFLATPVLYFIKENARRELPHAWSLATNVVPFVALVLATPALGAWRLARVMAVGGGILVAGHFLYLVLAIGFASAIARSQQIPTAIAQVFLTIPFLLWIVLAYWKQTMALLSGGSVQTPSKSTGSA